MLMRLPVDVLQHVVLPMLDYESRVCLNRVLPANERCCLKMCRNRCIAHQIAVSCLAIQSVLDRLEASPPCSSARIACYTDVFRRSIAPPHSILIARHARYKAVLIDKAIEMMLSKRGEKWGQPRRVWKAMHRAAARALRVCAALQDIPPKPAL
jgi:hypothetical protein